MKRAHIPLVAGLLFLLSVALSYPAICLAQGEAPDPGEPVCVGSDGRGAGCNGSTTSDSGPTSSEQGSFWRWLKQRRERAHWRKAGKFNVAGNAAFEKGDFATAIADYEKALRVAPGYAPVIQANLLAAKADQAHAAGDNDTAITYMQEALKIQPNVSWRRLFIQNLDQKRLRARAEAARSAAQARAAAQAMDEIRDAIAAAASDTRSRPATSGYGSPGADNGLAFQSADVSGGGTSRTSGRSASAQLKSAKFHGTAAAGAASAGLQFMDAGKAQSNKVFDTKGQYAGHLNTSVVDARGVRPEPVPPDVAKQPAFQKLARHRARLQKQQEQLEQQLKSVEDRLAKAAGDKGELQVKVARIKNSIGNLQNQVNADTVKMRSFRVAPLPGTKASGESSSSHR